MTFNSFIHIHLEYPENSENSVPPPQKKKKINFIKVSDDFKPEQLFWYEKITIFWYQGLEATLCVLTGRPNYLGLRGSFLKC